MEITILYLVILLSEDYFKNVALEEDAALFSCGRKGQCGIESDDNLLIPMLS